MQNGDHYGLNSMGFAKPESQTRVVVAMSGGVDSSVVAAMLKEQGYEVIGITLQLYDHGIAIQKKGACCAGQDIYDARNVAERIGIPHYVLDYETKFKDAVIDKFVDSYLGGETPIPCVECNQSVKFKDLLRTARDLGADCLATGHYVQRIVNNGRAELHKAADPTKDQTYFLFATTQEQLDFLRFPLGGLNKTQTRALAEKYALPVAQKPDSQDICFVPDGDYAAVVRRHSPRAAQPGKIVHVNGKTVGTHDGIVNFTVGQRRGLDIGGLAEPLYVVKLDAAQNHVVVGPREALARDTVMLRDINWLMTELTVGETQRVEVKLRSMQPMLGATLKIIPFSLEGEGGAQRRMRGGGESAQFQNLKEQDSHPPLSRLRSAQAPATRASVAPSRERESVSAVIILDSPHFGIAPGQAAVFYEGNRVLGGGWIAGTELRSQVPNNGVAA